MNSTKIRIPISNNVSLSVFGYKDVAKLSSKARHAALARSIKAGEPPLGLFRRLNALMIFHRYSNPRLSKIFMADRNWVRAKYLKANRS